MCVLASRMSAATEVFTTSTSNAAARPLPSRRRQSVCATTPLRVSASIERIWFWRSAGNLSIMRSTVEAAVLVCSVAKTRWPVSAVSIAVSIVSRSRISPTSTMSGSSRRAARRARAKLSVSRCTSRWLIRHFCGLCTNSTGSSIVMMCSLRVRLMLSMIAESVVDLPEPVGPVTTTSPFVR